MADKNGLLETAKGGIFFRKKKTRIIVNRNFSEWISRPMEEPFLWPPHLPRAVRFPCMCGGSKVQKGGGRNLANGRNYGRVGTRNPRTKRCYAYNILHFRLFLPYYRPCRFVFFLGGLRADGLRRRSPARGGRRRTRCGEKPTGPICRRTGIGKTGSPRGTAGIFTEKPRPTANAIICMR